MTQAPMTLERWKDFWRFFENQPHQQEAIELLYAGILKADSSLLLESSKWRQIFSQAQPKPQSNPLIVPYQSQRDNQSGTGDRECFSSSCAMVAMYYGKIKNDDDYNRIRNRFGDTTTSQAQVAALKSLGLNANFCTDGTTQTLERLIDEGCPVPVGWLHHGTAGSPTGGGHWSVLIGYTPTHWIMNDPFGEADVAYGGYVNATNGKGVQYSRQNWNPRWRVRGTAGWYMEIRD